MSIQPRIRLIQPVDISALLIGEGVTAWTQRDLSPYLPASAEAALIRRRSAPDRLSAGVLAVRPSGSIVERTGPNAVALDINRVQNTSIALVPDSLVWALEKWTRVDGLNRVDFRRSGAGNIPGVETLTLLGYGQGGKCFAPVLPAVDVSAVLPGDAVVAPVTVDLTPYLPAGVTAGAVELHWTCRTNAGQSTKSLHARETGTGDTSDVLTQVATGDDRVSLGKTQRFTVRCDANNQVDLWYNNTATTAVNTLALRGYYLEEVKA
jgi:hypothetical protein